MTDRNWARWFGISLLCCLAAMARPAYVDQDSDEHAAELAKYKALLADAATRLAAETDPDALAAAALFTYRTDIDAALALLDRASRLQLSPPGLTWLQATFCGAARACDPAPLEARFRAQDPDNALGWFADVHRGYAASDPARVDAALARAAALPVANIHFTSTAARLAEAVVHAGVMPPGEALVAVIGEFATAPVLVQLTAVARACDESGVQRPARAQSCRGLARSMMSGDSVLTEGLGIAIARRAWPENSAEWKAAAESRRIIRYRMVRVSEFEAMPEQDEKQAGDIIALFKAHPREQDMLAARLEARGIDPMPPAGWREPASP